MADRKTLLLVEDETSILFSVQRILELSGDYEVITAANGKTAIDKLAQVIPDLIISDIAMPEMDGIEFCKHVRKSESTRSIPFIFLTAKKERILEGIQTGSDDYIVKPFKVDELLVKIKSIFQRIESRREEALVQKGTLNDYNLDEILELCMKDAFSGELVLRNGENEGIIYLERGEISRINLLDHDEDQALDSLRKWHKGSFILRPKTIEIKSKRRSKSKLYRDKPVDLILPVQIAKDTWWTGRRNPDSLLQTNIFLRQFKSGQKLINYLFNPGPISDYSVISQKIAAVLDDVSNIHVYNLNQQDAYVTQNVQFIKKANPKAICVTTEGNWRLLAAYDISEKNVKYVNKMKDWRVKLATQHELAYISAPFCPARSTFLTYDLETRVLFCGELFSGILDRKNYSSFWMEDEHLDGILAYHQLHMPASNAIRYVLQGIRQLDPPPLMIAPLYGNLIRGDYVNEVIDHLDNLQVGSDLLYIKSTPEQAAMYLEAANEILESAYEIFTKEKVTKKLSADDRMQKLCRIEDSQVRYLNHQSGRVLEQMINMIVIGENENLSNQLKSEALKAVVSRKLPPISIGRDTTESMVKIPRNIFRN
ncbi:MAG: response regulator [Calditrichia bacterium]|nr:response regulator [Calditrichia bacterium]